MYHNVPQYCIQYPLNGNLPDATARLRKGTSEVKHFAVSPPSPNTALCRKYAIASPWSFPCAMLEAGIFYIQQSLLGMKNTDGASMKQRTMADHNQIFLHRIRNTLHDSQP